MSAGVQGAQPQAGWLRRAQAWGFHTPMLVFALRTAVAAFVALLIAKAIGLEHPHWAAMSVWASSQPTREHLLARGIYRFAGSVVGVAFAVALVLVAQDSLWVLALGLAAWGSCCAFLGNLQRGYMVYGCMLAGYSAAMVVLLHHGPAHEIGHLAWDRMWTVICGVATALCMSWCFAPRRKPGVLIGQNRQALAQVLQAAASQLESAHTPRSAFAGMPVLSRLAEVEELLELYPEGSRTARTTAQAMHWQQHCALELIYHMAQEAPQPSQVWGDVPAAQRSALAAALQALAAALAQPMPAQDALRAPLASLEHALRAAVQACEAALASQPPASPSTQPPAPQGLQALHGLLQAIEAGSQAEAYDLGVPGAQPPLAVFPALPLHRDWVGAKEAAWRSGGVLLVFGLLWAWTHNPMVGFGMLGLATMLLVFSAFESPSRTMAFVLRGQLIGAALALLCQVLVWPLAQSAWQMVWLTLPFALLGGLVFAHKRTAAGALDTNMAMFILLAPAFPDTAGFAKHLGFALAVVSGPALAWVAYRCIYPTNAQRRMRMVAATMWQQIPALAQRLTQPGTALHPDATVHQRWTAQLHHRLLRWVRWADKTQAPERAQLQQMALSLRSMYSALLQLAQWRADAGDTTPALRRAQRCIQLALARTAQWGQAAPAQQARAMQAAQAAWQRLAQQPGLPAYVQAHAHSVAQRDWPQLAALRQALELGQPPQPSRLGAAQH